MYDINTCKRTQPAATGIPDCFDNTHCENGGTPIFESNICWCECPVDWQGDSDCSKPTMPYKNLPEGSEICKYEIPFMSLVYHKYRNDDV